MGYFLLEVGLFLAGVVAVVGGWVPLTRQRRVRGAAARVVGAILMIPLPLFLVACKQCHVGPLRANGLILDDPLMPMTQGLVRLIAMSAAFACALAATVLACVSSELPRRD
jgi:hypothetical protein